MGFEINLNLKKLDFRSDTITLPTQEMLESILTAKLGDDVAREDPTVIELEETSAKIFGKEAGLLVTSGTQGNLIGILSQTTARGSEVILEKDSHTAYYEVGGISALGGVMVLSVAGINVYLTPTMVRENIRDKSNIHFPQTTLVCLENTHNRAGGTYFTVDQMNAVGKIAEEEGIGFHVDGARIFNAAIASDSSVKELTSKATSVTFCLSKGLSCPIGSVVVGSKELIDRARKLRKMLGGGLRQAGIIAAPGLVALRTMVNRLKDDHDNAANLAKGLANISGLTVNTPQTNMVLLTSKEPADMFVQKLVNNNILVYSVGPYTVRFVTHRHIDKTDIDDALQRIEAVMRQK